MLLESPASPTDKHEFQTNFSLEKFAVTDEVSTLRPLAALQSLLFIIIHLSSIQ